MRPAHAPMLLLEGIHQIFGLLARQLTRILDDAANLRALAEKQLRENIKRPRQPERVLHEIDTATATQLARHTHLDNVDHFLIRNNLLAFIDHVFGAARLAIPANLNLPRIQHGETSNPVIVAQDPHKRVAVNQQADEYLLEMIDACNANLGRVEPRRPRPKRRPRPITPNVRIHRQRGNRISDQPRTRIDGANLERLILIHHHAGRRSQLERIARSK